MQRRSTQPHHGHAPNTDPCRRLARRRPPGRPRPARTRHRRRGTPTATTTTTGRGRFPPSSSPRHLLLLCLLPAGQDLPDLPPPQQWWRRQSLFQPVLRDQQQQRQRHQRRQQQAADRVCGVRGQELGQALRAVHVRGLQELLQEVGEEEPDLLVPGLQELPH